MAEDLTQETFLRFFSSNSYINRGKPLAYLYTIAKNLCIDAYKAPVLETVTEDAACEQSVTDGDQTGMSLVETKIALKEAVGALPEDIQEMLLLRFSNELSINEISELSGLSRFAVRRRINSGLSMLKEALREDNFA